VPADREGVQVELDVALCLPREAETVAIVRDVAMTALRRLGVTETCVEDIRLALSEACNNVVDHSGVDDEYEVRLLVDGEQCEVRVIDKGSGFDFSTLPASVIPADSPRGRGVALMRALVDTVAFESRPEASTVVRLVKTLDLVPGGPLARLAASDRAD
jgi:serine/threonine-protein kinase RsbW